MSHVYQVELEQKLQESQYKEQQLELTIGSLQRHLEQITEDREVEAVSWFNALEVNITPSTIAIIVLVCTLICIPANLWLLSVIHRFEIKIGHKCESKSSHLEGGKVNRPASVSEISVKQGGKDDDVIDDVPCTSQPPYSPFSNSLTLPLHFQACLKITYFIGLGFMV